MKRVLGVAVLLTGLAGALIAADGPQIRLVDGKLSIEAESVALGRLLRLIDQATGMNSRVPPALANRNISVRFSGLPLDDGIKKVFEGQPIDYVVIQGHGIVVTAISQARNTQPSSPFPPAQTFQPLPETPFAPEEQTPFGQPTPMPGVAPPGMPQPGGMVPGQMSPGVPPNGPFNQQQVQPAIIQTPFGPIPNPRANQPMPNQGAVPPGQPQNPFGQPSPFGVTSPFGQPGAAPNQNNNLFGNTSPPIMNTSPNATPQQQRRP